MLIRVMLSEHPDARSPNIDLIGVGKDYGKSENLFFLLNYVMPHFLF